MAQPTEEKIEFKRNKKKTNLGFYTFCTSPRFGLFCVCAGSFGWCVLLFLGFFPLLNHSYLLTSPDLNVKHICFVGCLVERFRNYTVAHFSVDFSSVFFTPIGWLFLLFFFFLILALCSRCFNSRTSVQRNTFGAALFFIVENWFAPESRPLKLTVSRRWYASCFLFFFLFSIWTRAHM